MLQKIVEQSNKVEDLSTEIKFLMFILVAHYTFNAFLFFSAATLCLHSSLHYKVFSMLFTFRMPNVKVQQLST